MDDLVVLPEFDPEYVAPWDPTASSPSTSFLTRLDPTATSCSASATSTITTAAAAATATVTQLIMPSPLPVDAFQLGLRPAGFILPCHQFDAVNGHQLPPQLLGAADPNPPSQQQQQQNTGHEQHHHEHKHEHDHEPSGTNAVSEMGSEGRVVAIRNISHKRARTSPQSNTLVLPFSSGLKVRKEKLGDRITALQQLVSPFGKTDTASVLMEAIGYIKFMQQQVQVLIMPYTTSFERCNTDEEIDLRSRGLCLVPVSSQFINDKDDIMDCWTHSLERDLGNLCHKYWPVI